MITQIKKDKIEKHALSEAEWLARPDRFNEACAKEKPVSV
jgi:hypothetical protein